MPTKNINTRTISEIAIGTFQEDLLRINILLHLNSNLNGDPDLEYKNVNGVMQTFYLKMLF